VTSLFPAPDWEGGEAGRGEKRYAFYLASPHPYPLPIQGGELWAESIQGGEFIMKTLV